MLSAAVGGPLQLVILPVQVSVPLVASSVPPVELICIPLLNVRLWPVNCCNVPPFSVSVPVPSGPEVTAPGVPVGDVLTAIVPEVSVVPPEKVLAPLRATVPAPLTPRTAPAPVPAV